MGARCTVRYEFTDECLEIAGRRQAMLFAFCQPKSSPLSLPPPPPFSLGVLAAVSQPLQITLLIGCFYGNRLEDTVPLH